MANWKDLTLYVRWRSGDRGNDGHWVAPGLPGEYACIDDLLNGYGAAGWELVSVVKVEPRSD